jgi:hypothetical protein
LSRIASGKSIRVQNIPKVRQKSIGRFYEHPISLGIQMAFQIQLFQLTKICKC